MTASSTRALRVLRAGTFTTVQDAGRPGHAHLGVPRSGWLDPGAATLANRLVGNPEEAAVLECLLGGLVLETSAATTVAVTGGLCTVSTDGRPAPHGAAVAVPAGGRVRLGPVTQGLRSYLAVAGGILVDPVLGSRSTDTLSGLGPPPLSDGAKLRFGSAVGDPSPAEAVPASSPAGTVLRCAPGPRADWFAADAVETLASAAYRVGAASDRTGLRLDGPPLERARTAELPSEGLVLGAVQVPPDGRPIVFLNDHPTTGGYPVIAVVDARDVGRCAQLRPGDEVRFRPTRARPWPAPDRWR
jgi:biotin-dependent carboxylase-like uncharacterized protein